MRGRKPGTKNRRGQGKKNQDGVTQSIILLTIADNPGIKTDDIWDYMKSNKDELRRMRIKSLFYKHLGKLRKNKMIKATRAHRREEYAYTITPGFDNFVKIFNFMTRPGFRKTLMNSKFYREYTEIINFLDLYGAYRFRDNMLKVYAYYKHMGADAGVLYSLFRVPEGEQATFTEQYNELIGLLRDKAVDELPAILVNKMNQRGRSPIIGEHYLYGWVFHWIDKREEEALQAMWRERPMVIDFLINHHTYDVIFISNVAVFLLPSGGIDEEHFKTAMEYQANDTDLKYINIVDMVESYHDTYERDETEFYQIIKTVSRNDLLPPAIKTPTRKK